MTTIIRMIEYRDWWICGLRAWKLSPITSTDHFEKTLSEDCEATALCSKKKIVDERLHSLILPAHMVTFCYLFITASRVAALSVEVWSINATSNNDVPLSI